MLSFMLSFMLLNLTLEEIVTEIPHDAAALVVYLMLALFAGFIWYGSRGGPAVVKELTEAEAAPPQR